MKDAGHDFLKEAAAGTSVREQQLSKYRRALVRKGNYTQLLEQADPVLGLFALPVIAIFVRVPPGDLLDALGRSVTRDALLVSLKTSALAHAAVLVVGTPAAYLLARRRFRGRGAVLTLIRRFKPT